MASRTPICSPRRQLIGISMIMKNGRVTSCYKKANHNVINWNFWLIFYIMYITNHNRLLHYGKAFDWVYRKGWNDVRVCVLRNSYSFFSSSVWSTIQKQNSHTSALLPNKKCVSTYHITMHHLQDISGLPQPVNLWVIAGHSPQVIKFCRSGYWWIFIRTYHINMVN